MASHVASLWNRGLVQLGNDLLATLRLRDRPGRDGCQSALWDCFGERIFNMAANSNEGAKAEEEMKLQEIDVLGWELLKPTQYCIVSILKRWLASGGAKLSGERLKELIKRCGSVIRAILGDWGAVSRAARKFSSTGGKAPRYRLSPDHKRSSECWLLIGHRKWFVLLSPIGEQFLLSSFRKFVHDCYCLATVALFTHQAFLTRNEGTTDESKNVSDAIGSSNLICTEKILFLTDHNVS